MTDEVFWRRGKVKTYLADQAKTKKKTGSLTKNRTLAFLLRHSGKQGRQGTLKFFPQARHRNFKVFPILGDCSAGNIVPFKAQQFFEFIV